MDTTMPKIGQKAPSFSLPSTSGKTVSLGDFAGKKVVLYFYPRDATPGCTREACDFRDRHGAVLKTGAVVLGVSSDTLASHAKFRTAEKLPFDLLSDAGNAVAKKFGAFGEKTLYGKKSTGTIRSTFVIDEQGVVTAAWSPVRVDGHAEAVLAALSGKSGSDAKPTKAAKPAKAASKAKAKPTSAPKLATKPAKTTKLAASVKSVKSEKARTAKKKTAAR